MLKNNFFRYDVIKDDKPKDNYIMKKTVLILVAIVFAINLNTQAHDFLAVNSDGDTIYYKITSNVAPYTVAVTFKGTAEYEYENEYKNSISIPDSVLRSGRYYKVTSIYYYAFYFCTELTSVTIPNSVTIIRSSAFNNCIGLTSVTIPNGVTLIGNAAFNGCTGLTSITVPDSVTKIEAFAFADCSNLRTATIGESVTTIETSIFEYCNSLTSLNFNAINCNELTNCFQNMPALDTINFGNQVLTIPASAFRDMSGITTVLIGNSVTAIGSYAFADCDSITSINLPNSLRSIGSAAFNGSDGLTSITIPNSVTSIGGFAFYQCTGLTSISLPNSLAVIERYTFFGCSALTSITIPESVTEIGNGAFAGCVSFTSFTIPKNVTTIGSDVVTNCNLLTYIRVEAINPPALYYYSFNEVSWALPLYVPCESVSRYGSDIFWGEFTNIIGFKTALHINTSICEGSFYTDYGANIDSAGVYTLVNGCDSVILILSVMPLLEAPYNLRFIDNERITLAWQGDTYSYDIYRDDSLVANVADTVFVDNFNMINGHTYCYKIKAKNIYNCESEFSDTVCVAVIGLENVESTNIQTKLYPNPTNGKSVLELEGLTSDADVLVYDMEGRVIKTYKVNKGTKELEIDLSGYFKGVFSIRIVNERIDETKKLVVE